MQTITNHKIRYLFYINAEQLISFLTCLIGPGPGKAYLALLWKSDYCVCLHDGGLPPTLSNRKWAWGGGSWDRGSTGQTDTHQQLYTDTDWAVLSTLTLLISYSLEIVTPLSDADQADFYTDEHLYLTMLRCHSSDDTQILTNPTKMRFGSKMCFVSSQ